MSLGFILGLDRDNLANVQFSETVGGESITVATDVKVDSLGNIILVGFTQDGWMFSGPGLNPETFCESPYDSTYNDFYQSPDAPRGDAFLMLRTPHADTLLCGTYLGGDMADAAWAVDLDSLGKVVVAGGTFSWEFPGIIRLGDRDLLNHDVFLAKFDATLEDLKYSRIMRSPGYRGEEEALDVVVGDQGLTAICGYTWPDTTNEEWEFEVTEGAYDETKNGGKDCFVALFDILECGQSEVAVPAGSPGEASSGLSAFPNPFNPSVVFGYILRESG